MHRGALSQTLITAEADAMVIDLQVFGHKTKFWTNRNHKRPN